jgi:arsenite oxidase large subunit
VTIRGARIAEMSYSRQRNTQLQRLTDPMVWRYGQMQPTSWDDALDLVARITVGVINEMGEDGLFVSAFDHGGAGGGYENTWGTGKLIPNYKQTWGAIRKLADAPEAARHLSFKSLEYAV